MLFSNISILSAFVGALSSNLIVNTQAKDLFTYFSDAEGRTCVCDFDPQVDYFEKVSPSFATGFSVEYHNYYKTITSRVKGKEYTYVAYLCGTQVPANLPEGAIPVEIPLQSVGVTTTTYIPFMEYIRQRDTLNFVMSTADSLAHSCLKKRADEGELQTISGWTLEEEHMDDTYIEALFVDSYTQSSAEALKKKVESDITLISMGATEEATALGTLEWVEFVSLFFNREAAASNVAENIELRYQCAKDKVAAKLAADNSIEKPNVLWGSYYMSKWTLAKCPGAYYCDMVKDAGGNLLDWKNEEDGTYSYTTEQFEDLPLETVDVLIITTGFDSLLASDSEFNATMRAMPVFDNERIFDISKSGTSAYFQYRPAEPDVFFMDIVEAILPDLNLGHERVYLKNVLSGEAVIDPLKEECPDETEPLFSNWKKSVCQDELIDIPGLEKPVQGCQEGESGESEASAEVIAFPLASVAAAVVVCLAGRDAF